MVGANVNADPIPEVRILPMANDIPSEFAGCETIADVQQNFFLADLPSREDGSYWYRKNGLRAKTGAKILFQCQSKIIASATFIGSDPFDQAIDGYEGSLQFEPTSIKVFDPVGEDVIREIWPEMKKFSHVRWELDAARYAVFESRLTGVIPWEETPSTEMVSDLDKAPDRVHASTYRILRDTEVARRVKSLHNFKCQICGHSILLPSGEGYAEAHHVRPLGRPHDGPDVTNNVICVCPNHHAELDYGAIPIVYADLRIVAGHSINKEHVDYHNNVHGFTK